VAPEKVKNLIFCSGQVYYDLNAYRTKNNRNDVAIVRVEQLCPFPFRYLKDEIDQYKNAKVIWAQEEHQNQGPWTYVRPRFNNIYKKAGKSGEISYSGRAISASTATGYHKLHESELQSLLKEAFK